MACYARVMSKKNFPNLSMEQRAELASQVKKVRLAVGLTQQELADEAKVTRQSIGNIETGMTVPQMKTLGPILEVLGITAKPTEFAPEISKWLSIVGGMMTTLPADRQARAGQAAVNAVAGEMVATSSNVGGSDDDATDGDDLQIPENVQKEWGLAAHPETEGPQDHTP